MIDIDKYEGHSTEYSYEIVSVDDDKEMDATYALLNDAPLLLAEVKRLNRFVHCAMLFMSKHDLDYQFLNQHGVFTAPGGGSISTFTPYSYKWDDETKVSSEPIKFTVRGEEE